MPKHVYFCKECEICFEVSHSLRETFTICENCGINGMLVRRPSKIFLTKKQRKMSGNLEAGTVVKEAIDEAKQELKQEQQNLTNRIYEDK